MHQRRLTALYKAFIFPLVLRPKAVKTKKNQVFVWGAKKQLQGDSWPWSAFFFPPDVLARHLMPRFREVRFPCWGQETGKSLKKQAISCLASHQHANEPVWSPQSQLSRNRNQKVCLWAIWALWGQIFISEAQRPNTDGARIKDQKHL